MSTNEACAREALRLTWDEICKRFPEEWVVLADADWVNDTDFEFGSAEVIAHHKHRGDASHDVKVVRAQDRDVGCFWTGAIRGTLPRLFL